MCLTRDEIEDFVQDGFVKIAGAFPEETAGACRARLWQETGKDPADPATWTEPVIRIPPINDPPFLESCNTPRLHRAYDQLYGAGRWIAPEWPGTFPVRFPHPDTPMDTAWHFDAGWHVDEQWFEALEDGGDLGKVDPYGFRYNIHSRGRALLILPLYSDVGPDDAPTVIRVGSHLDVPAMLAPFGEEGCGLIDDDVLDRATAHRREVLATGRAGDVYLVHPFLVHAAQANRTGRPKFMAQASVEPRELVQTERADGTFSPVERAVRIGLGLA
ncbi:phytanoyl-CoA dioxygenase family protein [Streptomyces sp. DSM 41527]|uniref:Phytanoyl-CoA dioxygenase family protein n=1 Tax=Streptomyces mooreae TaxID=3075523 RepID=A0ABU2T6I9_9ACTN|nr:phytanoyl-CoA dioxygenase family protein [Streptomyces sp. DSM 41527]MDT0456838.1 phytanoyl-CoA dioxygenase family protein [Streptomyces sp. DSM 41527]